MIGESAGWGPSAHSAMHLMMPMMEARGLLKGHGVALY